MRTSSLTSLILSLLVVGVIGAQTTPTIKKVPLSQTSPVSGKQMFGTYCAVCHGENGKGAGPAAVALKKQPTDLTQLSAKNGGKFPELAVTGTLSGNQVSAAHGSQEMPIWGDLFKSLGGGRNDLVQLRIVNLTSYVESIQTK